jgi:Rod binding domain-containing protein
MEPVQEKPIPIAPRKSLSVPIAKKEIGSKKNTTVREAAQNFEALFVMQVMQEMEKSLENGSIFGNGLEGKTYGDLMKWEIAKNISTQSPLGIAEALVKQLEPQKAAQSPAQENIP